jgi:hypothetical protein
MENSNVYIGARVEQGLKTLIESVCKSRGEDISDFIRRSIRKELASLSYLPAEDKKALGIKPEAAAQ